MLIAALHFWDSTTHSLHLKCGMLAPTLLDVAAITGLKPLGPVFDPTTTVDAYTFDFNSKRATFQNYIEDHHITTSEDVSDEKHIAFLTTWLSYYVFCSSSLQVAKMFINLAIQLHKRREVNLSQLILGVLYESLQQGVQTLKDFKPEDLKQIKNYSVSGPIWLFQLWLLATFESQMQYYIPEDYIALVEERSFEGLRLALLRPREIGVENINLFSKAFKMFMNCEDFTPAMAPFVIRTHGPDWFKRQFPATTLV